MAKFFFTGFILCILFFFSCGTNEGTDKLNIEVNYDILENETEINKIYSFVTNRLDTNIRYVEKLDITVACPSRDGAIVYEDKKDYMTIELDYLSRDSIVEDRYDTDSKDEAWQSEIKTAKTVNGKNGRKNKVFDLSSITPDIIYKVVKNALVKYKDREIYEYQYIKSIVIEDNSIRVDIYGKTIDKAQQKYESYTTDLKGNITEK